MVSNIYCVVFCLSCVPYVAGFSGLSIFDSLTFIGGVMVSVFASSAVDCGFIGGVMVSMLDSSAVDCGFIGGVMVSVVASSA